MAKSPSPKITYCLCGDQAIFLDVAKDRYFQLSASQNRSFVHRVNGNAVICEPKSTSVMRLLAQAEPCRQIAMPSHNLQSEAHMSIDPICITRAALAYAAAAIRLKRYGLAEVLLHMSGRRRSQPNRAKPDIYNRLASAFRSLTPIFGRAENCLPRSIAFYRLALAAGHAPALVIGVKRDPFAAHCWVQDGACVLNDSAEHVRVFTPILVI